MTEFEIPMDYQDWDKEGDFNETWFLHMLNLGWVVKAEFLTPKEK